MCLLFFFLINFDMCLLSCDVIQIHIPNIKNQGGSSLQIFVVLHTILMFFLSISSFLSQFTQTFQVYPLYLANIILSNLINYQFSQKLKFLGQLVIYHSIRP